VGHANFEWIIREVADMAISKAQDAPKVPQELRWSAFLSGARAASPAKKTGAAKTLAKKAPAKKAVKTANPTAAG
jgi:hypothetical protein